MAVQMIPNFDLNASSLFDLNTAHGDEYVRCARCSFGGCDVRVQGCGCCLHARCTPLRSEGALTTCPHCARPTTGLVLFPMSFREIDEAKKTMASFSSARRNTNRKRKSGEITQQDEKGTYVSERRTGRWTTEEMAYCDKLIETFQSGLIPVTEGLKLNEFLGAMLKSKQSRLTKKMKNAKLSSKTFNRTFGYLTDINQARDFSELEDAFFHSIHCHQDRAEIKFHMQKEWREMFSNICIAIGQPLDADGWLSSVEEMDRRSCHARDAARMTRRKLMMGFALRTDAKNPDQGVFIEKPQLESQDSIAHVLNSDDPEHAEEMLSLLAEKSGLESKGTPGANAGSKSSMLTSAPFLSKVIMYLERHNVPFEHVDLWVPSFIPDPDSIDGGTICRLCHAGSATTDNQVKADGKTVVPLSGEEHFMLQAFGDYSQKFSFDVGCGLPGRIYQSGLPTWEQNVQNAPHNHFERCGGAKQWEIKTVVGIPIASPNVGRIVATLYSREDRPKNQELVGRLSDEFTRLMPSPKWKLVVDIGEPEPLNHVSSCQNLAASDVAEIISVTSPVIQSTTHNSENTIHTVTASPTMSFTPRDTRSEQVVSLLGEFMPSDPSSPLVTYLSGFMSLRLMLLRQNRSHEEEETMRIVLDSFASYSSGGRARNDIALMLARDYMFLTQHQEQRQQHSSLSPMMGAQQPPAHSLSSNQMPQSSSQTPSSGYWMQISPNNGPTNSFHKSPSLAPIGGQGNTMDSMNLIST